MNANWRCNLKSKLMTKSSFQITDRLLLKQCRFNPRARYRWWFTRRGWMLLIINTFFVWKTTFFISVSTVGVWTVNGWCVFAVEGAGAAPSSPQKLLPTVSPSIANAGASAAPNDVKDQAGNVLSPSRERPSAFSAFTSPIKSRLQPPLQSAFARWTSHRVLDLKMSSIRSSFSLRPVFALRAASPAIVSRNWWCEAICCNAVALKGQVRWAEVKPVMSL